MPRENILSSKELEEFRQKLEQQLEVLQKNIINLRENVFQRSRMDDSGDITNIPTHIADISNDVVYHDITLGLMRNEVQVLQEIQDALVRIKEKTFGICEQCQKPIMKKRLEYVPYTRLCINCKSEQERRQRRDSKDVIMW